MEGVKSIHAITPPLNAQYILIRPPSVEALEKRLRDRGTETNETIAKRIERAKKDIEFSESEAGRNLFHKVIINDDLNMAYKELESALRPALNSTLSRLFSSTRTPKPSGFKRFLGRQYPVSLDSKYKLNTTGVNSVGGINWLDPEPLISDKRKSQDRTESLPAVSYRVHAFYYAWYNAPSENQSVTDDRHWVHWNHVRLAHHNPRIASEYSTKPHRPPKDIGASFYPQVCLHIEPYFFRTARSIVSDLSYAHQRGYTTHPAYFRLPAPNHPTDPKKSLPVFFVYDSYTIRPEEWASALLTNGSTTIRGKPYDAYMVGLLMELTDCELFNSIGFNGGYTYFIAKNTNQPSDSMNWQLLGLKCRQSHVDFYPSVGPGYDDSAIRPYNTHRSVHRTDGNHYSNMFFDAIRARPAGFGITSFNEWGEGSQIEPAKPANRPLTWITTAYLDYQPFSADFYLRLTRVFVNAFEKWSELPPSFDAMNANEAKAVYEIMARVNTTV
ncbi:hypothetical protein PHET_07314 [Paragonimus heterotremus]|uniref:Guanylate kinase-like domain-containing protein n=1 Tax=Paragonimus heterotremus TaxID=100268 RepID=A0A8J4WFS1_9TREM|nr:hypothetical protein PHET_07314 [Paragonimus heterotremus]